MERKIQREKGFIFNEETKRLESFELKKAEFQFADGTPIVYTAIIGGEERTFESDDEFKVYPSVEEFRNDSPYAPTIVSTGDYKFRSYRYAFDNGKAVAVDLHTEKFVFENGSVEPLRKCYQEKQDVYVFNDLVVCEDGVERVVPCLKKLLALDDDQAELYGEFVSLIERMKGAGIKMFLNDWNGKLSVINARKVTNTCYGYEAHNEVGDDHVDIYHLLQNENVSVDISVFNDDHDVMVKIED